MSKTMTIILPDALEQALTQTAARTQQSAEDLIVELLTQNLIPGNSSSSAISPSTPDFSADPLFQLAGCISSDLTDAAENHDRYIGQALYEEMHQNG